MSLLVSLHTHTHTIAHAYRSIYRTFGRSSGSATRVQVEDQARRDGRGGQKRSAHRRAVRVHVGGAVSVAQRALVQSVGCSIRRLCDLGPARAYDPSVVRFRFGAQ